MRLSFFLLFTIISLVGSAQVIDKYLVWAKSAPPSYATYGAAVRQSDLDPGRNLYVIGTFYKQVPYPPDPTQQYTVQYVYVSKYSTDGDLIWTKEMGTNSEMTYSTAGDIRVDKNGNIVFTAYVYDPDGTLFGKPITGFFLAKMDPDGNILWVKETPKIRLDTYDGQRSKQSHMEIDKDNSIVLNFDYNLTGPYDAAHGLYISRYSDTGDLLGEYQITHDDNFDAPVLGGLAIDSQGNFIITGYYHVGIHIGSVTLGNPGPQSPAGVQLFIAKFSSIGEFVWAKEINSDLSEGYDIEIDETDHIYLTGIFGATAIFDHKGQDINTTSGSCGFLAYLTSEGDLSWVKLFERLPTLTYSYANPIGLKRTANGFIYITGYCNGGVGFNGFALPRPEEQAFVLKLNPDASFASVMASSSKIIGIDFREAVNSSIDTDGNIYTIGNFYKRIVFGCDSLLSTGDNMFITKHNEFPPLFEVQINGPEFICDGATINLSGTSVPQPAQYLWNLPTGVTNTLLIDPSTNQITVQVSADANNKLISLTIQKGCYSYDNLLPYQINVKYPPAPASLNGQELFCDPTTARYYTSETISPASYLWTLPSGINPVGSGTITTNPFIDVNITNDFDSGSIQVKSRNQCGDSQPALLPVQLVKKPSLISFESGSKELCNQGQSVTYQGSVSDRATEYVWNLPAMFKEAGTIETNTPEINLTLLKDGSGSISLFGKNKCHQSDPLTVNVLVHDPLRKPVILKNNCGTELHSTNANDGPIQWFGNDILLTEGVNRIEVIDSGAYHISISNFCGTVSSDIMNVKPIADQTLFVPNVITPNNDGKNESFVLGNGTPNLELDIFNRWGETIYHSKDYHNDWNGDNHPNGTYYFQLSHPCLTHAFKGWVQIMR